MRRLLILVVALGFLPSLAAAQEDQAVVNRVLGNVPDLVTSVADPEVPAGTIRVEVVDPSEAPAVKQAIRLGIMEQSGGRDTVACVTDAEGICSFEELANDCLIDCGASACFGNRSGGRIDERVFR